MVKGQYKRTETNSARNRQHPALVSARTVYGAGRSRGYADGTMTLEQFLNLSQRPCHYCGAPPSNLANAYRHKNDVRQWTKDNADFRYNGIDRVDSSLPHNIDNVVPCCANCNYMKRALSVDDFHSHIIRIYNHLNLQSKN